MAQIYKWSTSFTHLLFTALMSQPLKYIRFGCFVRFTYKYCMPRVVHMYKFHLSQTVTVDNNDSIILLASSLCLWFAGMIVCIVRYYSFKTWWLWFRCEIRHAIFVRIDCACVSSTCACIWWLYIAPKNDERVVSVCLFVLGVSLLLSFRLIVLFFSVFTFI